MAGTVDYVRETLEKSYALVKASAQDMFIALLKISVAQVLLSLAGVMLIGILVFLLLGASIAQTISTGALAPALLQNAAIVLLMAIPIFAITTLAAAAFKSVGYNIIDDMGTGRATDLLGCARKNFWPIAKLQVVIWVVMLLLGSPLLLSFLLIGTAGSTALLALCILIPLSMLAVLLFTFIIQFSTVEVVLGGKGPIGAIKASAGLVKRELLGVILIDIVIVVCVMALSVVSGMASSILRLIMQIFSAVGGTAGLAVGSAIYVLCALAVGVVVGAAMEMAVLPIIYNFWKGKKG